MYISGFLVCFGQGGGGLLSYVRVYACLVETRWKKDRYCRVINLSKPHKFRNFIQKKTLLYSLVILSSLRNPHWRILKLKMELFSSPFSDGRLCIGEMIYPLPLFELYSFSLELPWNFMEEIHFEVLWFCFLLALGCGWCLLSVVVEGVEKSSSLGPKDHSFSFLLQTDTILGCVGKGSSPLSYFGCFVMLEDALLKLKSIFVYFGLKGMIFFVLMKDDIST